MTIWYTWLAYFGLVAGLAAASIFNWPAMRTAVIGFGGGLVIMVLLNAVSSASPPCLQNAKGWDILRAYSLNCVSEQELLLQNANKPK